MKNLKSRLISAATAVLMASSAVLLTPGCALGQDITVILNGDELAFDTQPRIVDGTTLVPMRKIFEELGMTVSWNSGNSTVTAVKNGKSVVARIGDKNITVNGETQEAGAAPTLADGTTLVPLRIVSEALGADVDWDGATGTVTITKEDKKTDDAWKDNTAVVDLSAMTINGQSVSGKVIRITEPGDYTVTGTAADAMIHVNSDGRVKLRLSGIDLTNTSGPAIFFENCDKGYITITKDTVNKVADGQTYDVDAKAAIFSNDDLEIKGSGTLIVNAVYNHGIASDDGLRIEEGTINITAVNDGIHSNDGITVKGGDITIKATGDGIQSEDYIEVEDGTITITTDGEVEASSMGWGGFGGMGGGFGGGRMGRGGIQQSDRQPQDAMRPQGDIEARGGMQQPGQPPEIPQGDMGNPPEIPQWDMNNPPERPQGDMGNPPEFPREGMGPGGNRPDGIAPDGGAPETMAQTAESSSASSKGIKAETNLIISGGNITVNSTDHCLHSSGLAFISGGTMTLSSERKKGISAHAGLVIEDGDINVLKSTEGIESKSSYCINGGTIHVVASDDGLNAGGTNGRDAGNDDSHSMYINGGYIYVNAGGDGIDSNAVLHFNGGTVVVSGPTNSGNGALDSGGSIVMTGGTLIAAGSIGMAEYPRGEGCTQPSISYGLSQVMGAGEIIRIEDSNGNELVTFRNSKQFQSLVYSSPLLEIGKEYRIYTGGQYSGGTEVDGVLSGGNYSGGTLAESFTLESISQAIGTADRGFGGGMGGFGGGRGGRMM